MNEMNDPTPPKVDYIRFARRLFSKRWRLMLGIFLVIAVPTVTWVMLFMDRMYEAVATIYIDPGKDEPTFLRGLMNAEMSGLYLAILRSRSLAQGVVDSLPREARDELIKRRNEDYLLAAQNWFRRLLRQDIVVYSPQEQAVMELQDARMAFTFQKDGTVIVTATAFSPRVATDLANTYTDVLLARSGSAARESARATREMIESMLVQGRTSQQEAEEILRKFHGGNQDMKVPDQARFELIQLADLENRLSELQVTREIAQARLAAMRGNSAEKAAPAPLVVSLRQRLAQLESKLAGLLERYTDGHPLVLTARGEIEETQEQLRGSLKGQPMPRVPGAVILSPAERAAMSKELADLEVTVASAQAKENGLRQRIARVKAALSSLNSKEMEYSSLARGVETQRNLVAMLTEKLNAARLNEQATIRSIRIIDQASQPKAPASKKMLLPLLVGICGGLGLAFGVGLLLEHVNEVIETEEDVVRITGYPVLGSIPVVAHARGRDPKEPVNFLLDNPAFTLALEACRAVRTSVEFQDSEHPPKVIVLTSPGAGEGKSTVIFNLGWVFWETGRRTLLVDADLRRPSLHRAFQIPNEVGLVDLLRQNLEWQEVTRTAKEGIDFIPSGIEPANPGALLSSRHMKRMLEFVRARFDLVLLDSPPLLAVSDNLALASQVDGIVLVVRSGFTKRRSLVRAKAQLERIRGHVLGVVVNGLSPRDTRRYYTEYTHYVAAGARASERRTWRAGGRERLRRRLGGLFRLPQRRPVTPKRNGSDFDGGKKRG
jgi:capsular exopolysaccharide synthesis family protein